MRTDLQDKTTMTAFDQTVRHDLDILVSLRARELGTNRDYARETVARETKLPLGTLQNIAKNRTMGVRGRIAEMIRKTLMKQIEREMQRLNHELQILIRRGTDTRSDEMAEIVSLLDRARNSLEAMK